MVWRRESQLKWTDLAAVTLQKNNNNRKEYWMLICSCTALSVAIKGEEHGNSDILIWLKSLSLFLCLHPVPFPRFNTWKSYHSRVVCRIKCLVYRAVHSLCSTTYRYSYFELLHRTQKAEQSFWQCYSVLTSSLLLFSFRSNPIFSILRYYYQCMNKECFRFSIGRNPIHSLSAISFSITTWQLSSLVHSRRKTQLAFWFVYALHHDIQ